jgi:hypothetical protein
MGVDLCLLPIKNIGSEYVTIRKELRLDRYRALLGVISDYTREAPSIGLPVMIEGELVTEDPYGCSLTWLKAEDFKQWANHEGVLGNSHNQEIWDYLDLIKPETKILLYWW